MNATLFSLIAVCLSFTGLLLWVFWPSRREQLESLGRIPLEDDHSPGEVNDMEPPHE